MISAEGWILVKLLGIRSTESVTTGISPSLIHSPPALIDKSWPKNDELRDFEMPAHAQLHNPSQSSVL